MNDEFVIKETADERIFELLPYRLASAAVKCSAANHAPIDEIRLRVGQPMYITSHSVDFKSSRRVTGEDIEYTLRCLSSNSLYSHAETIREGYITSKSGIRAGLCGRAVTHNGEIDAVTDITSLSLRFPRRVPSCADCAYSILKSSNFSTGLLIYSKPGVGKTTVLRELIYRLSNGDDAVRVAVVDTRCELVACSDGFETADVLSAYPRERGIEIATRTLSPRYIICDEIGSAEDAEAIFEGARAGVYMIASAHGGSFEEVMHSQHIRNLWECGVFGTALGLISRDSSGECSYEISQYSDSAPAVVCI